MITPLKNETEMKGTVVSNDTEWQMDYEFTDDGYTGKCPIKVKYHKAPRYIEAYLYDRHGNVTNRFGKTWGSNGYKAICSELIGGKITLWHKTETWATQSYQIAELPIRAMNGMSLEINIRKHLPQGEEADDQDFEVEFEGQEEEDLLIQ